MQAADVARQNENRAVQPGALRQPTERHVPPAGGFHERTRGDPLAVALLILLALALNWRAVFSTDNLPGSGDGSDIWTSHWGNAAFLKQTLAATGRIPLWNPRIMSGRPFAGDPLAAIFYPPMQLVSLLSLRDFILLLLLGHLVLAGIGAYLLARRGLRLSPPAAFFAGLAFMWSTRFIGHYGAGHLTMIMAAAWLPWVALGFVLAVRESPIWAAPAVMAFGLAILAGHPQIAFYHALMLGALTAAAIVWALAGRAPRRRRVGGALRVVAITAVVGVVGGLIGAALALPALQFTSVSLREGGLTVSDRLAVTSVLHGLITVPIHRADPQELTFAPGIPVLLLAPLAFLRRRALASGLLAGVLLAAILALGARTPVLPVLAAHVPGFDLFRAPARIWFLGTLALALLAGLGFDAFFDGAARTRLVALGKVVVIVTLAVNLWLLDTPLLNIRPAGPGQNPLKVEAAAARLAGATRIYGVQRNIRQALTTPLGLELADGQDPLQIAAYARFMQLAGGYHFDGYTIAIPPYQVYDPGWPTHQDAQPNARLLGLLNVGIVLSRTPLHDTALVQVGKEDKTFIYRNNAILPRAFLVSRALGASLEQASIDDLARRTAAGEVGPDPAAGTSTVTGIGTDGLAVRVDARQDGYLIIGDPWYPGWRARIDGRDLPLEQVGGVLQGVAVPAGTHTIRVEYHPSTVEIGLLLSLAGLLAAAAWTGWFALRLRREARG